MQINFYWLFLRKKLDITQVEILNTKISAYLDVIAHDLQSKYPFKFMVKASDSGQKGTLQSQEAVTSSLHKQNSSVTIRDSVLILQIISEFGDFVYIHDVLYLFLGYNNCLCLLNLTDSQNFPDFYAFENEHVLSDLILNIGEKLKFLLENELEVPENDIFEAKGFHGCVLGCGDCCDFGKFTLSPLIGGMYCPGVTEAGKICLYYFFGYPPIDKVCEQYNCHKTQDLFVSESRNIGALLEKFIPEYPQEDIDELFLSVETYRNTKDINQAIRCVRKYEEVKEYSIVSNQLMDIIEKIDPMKSYSEKILLALAHNDLVKARNYTDDLLRTANSAAKDQKDLIRHLFDRLTKWKTTFEQRKAKYK